MGYDDKVEFIQEDYDVYPVEDDVYADDDVFANEQIPKLIDFYNTHIKGRTKEMLEIGNEICHDAYEIWRKLPEKPGYVFDKSLRETYVEAYWKKNMLFPIDYLYDSYDFARDYETYSDWHKEIYYVRPRLSLPSEKDIFTDTH